MIRPGFLVEYPHQAVGLNSLRGFALVRSAVEGNLDQGVKHIPLQAGEYLLKLLTSQVDRLAPVGTQYRNDGGVGSVFEPAHEIAAVSLNPAEQLILEETQVEEEDVVLNPGPEAHGLDIGGLAGIDLDALRVARDPKHGVYLKLGFAPCPRKLFGQLLVQPYNCAICYHQILEPFQFFREHEAGVTGKFRYAVRQALL